MKIVIKIKGEMKNNRKEPNTQHINSIIGIQFIIIFIFFVKTSNKFNCMWSSQPKLSTIINMNFIQIFKKSEQKKIIVSTDND